jgi:hypothetical protein
MGFRNIDEFNKALLGKQCWRLATVGSSLLEKIFKGRCYPNNDFMCAKEGYQPSYAWQSILSARTLVEKCGLWKICDSRKVRIWKDIWVSDMKIISSRNNNCPLLMLLKRDLIYFLECVYSMTWKCKKLFYNY